MRRRDGTTHLNAVGSGLGPGGVFKCQSAASVSPKLVGRVQHREDVLQRHVRLNVMDLVEHVAAAGTEDFNRSNVLANLLQPGKPSTGVAAAAPATSQCRTAAGRGSMFTARSARDSGYRSGFDEMRDQVVNGAATVEEGLQDVCAWTVAELAVVRLSISAGSGG